VKLPSVTNMVKKLSRQKLVSYTPYLSISLTASGERQAKEVVRHHRLLETYLQKALGFGIDTVHGEADRLEHALSAELEEKIDLFLGRPPFDPHGSPIPDVEGHVGHRELVSLMDVPPGQEVTVRQITCRGQAELRHLESRGVVPGAVVTVVGREPGSGYVRLMLREGPAEALGNTIAQGILVARGSGVTS
jgi:DtxR family Mn-dependent transcriptional regulator